MSSCSDTKPILKFHTKHGKNVKREQGGSRIVRKAPSNDCIVFGDRGISIDERVCLRLAELSSPDECQGALRIGVVSSNPSGFSGLMRRQLAELSRNGDGCWITALPAWNAAQGDLIQFSISSAGDVFYSINGENKGILLSGIPTDFILNVVVELSGIAKAIEFVRPQVEESDEPAKSSTTGLKQCTAKQKKPSTREKRCSCNDDCSICMEAVVNAVMYTCGHMVTCYECAVKIKMRGNNCPICRMPIRDVIKTFKS